MEDKVLVDAYEEAMKSAGEKMYSGTCVVVHPNLWSALERLKYRLTESPWRWFWIPYYWIEATIDEIWIGIKR